MNEIYMYIAHKATTLCHLASRRATYGPYKPQLDGPFRRAKNGPSQMRRPVRSPPKQTDRRTYRRRNRNRNNTGNEKNKLKEKQRKRKQFMFIFRVDRCLYLIWIYIKYILF